MRNFLYILLVIVFSIGVLASCEDKEKQEGALVYGGIPIESYVIKFRKPEYRDNIVVWYTGSDLGHYDTLFTPNMYNDLNRGYILIVDGPRWYSDHFWVWAISDTPWAALDTISDAFNGDFHILAKEPFVEFYGFCEWSYRQIINDHSTLYQYKDSLYPDQTHNIEMERLIDIRREILNVAIDENSLEKYACYVRLGNK